MPNNQWVVRPRCAVYINTFFQSKTTTQKYRFIRKINEYTLNDFLIKVSYENWDTVFSTEDVNKMFNSFLDTYLEIANSSFTFNRVYITNKNSKNWITSRILTSCRRKRELYIASRISNNLDFIAYYKRYCKILSIVIKEAKKLNYAEKIKKICEQKQNCLGYSKPRNK